MVIKLLTEHHLEFLSLKEGCTGSSESTHVKMPHCWKSHVTSHIIKGTMFVLNDIFSCNKKSNMSVHKILILIK